MILPYILFLLGFLIVSIHRSSDRSRQSRESHDEDVVFHEIFDLSGQF